MRKQIQKLDQMMSLESFSSTTVEELDNDINPISNEPVAETDLATECYRFGIEMAEVETAMDQVTQADRVERIGRVIVDTGNRIEARGDVTVDEAALLQTGVAQTAVALGGDDEDVRQMVEQTSTESLNGIVISTESLSGSLRQLFSGVINILAMTAKKVKNLASHIYNIGSKVIRELVSLRDSIGDQYKGLKDGITEITDIQKSWADLTIDGKLDSAKFANQYKTVATKFIDKTTKMVNSDPSSWLQPNLPKVVEEMKKQLNINDVEDCLRKFYDKMTDGFKKNLISEDFDIGIGGYKLVLGKQFTRYLRMRLLDISQSYDFVQDYDLKLKHDDVGISGISPQKILSLKDIKAMLTSVANTVEMCQTVAKKTGTRIRGEEVFSDALVRSVIGDHGVKDILDANERAQYKKLYTYRKELLHYYKGVRVAHIRQISAIYDALVAIMRIGGKAASLARAHLGAYEREIIKVTVTA